MRWEGHVARVGGGQEKFVQGFVGKTGGKMTLGRHRSTWEDDTRMDRRRIGGSSVNGIHVAAFVNAVLKLRDL